MEPWIKDLLETTHYVDFTTFSESHIPRTVPMIIFYDKGYFMMTESVVLSDKFELIN